MAGLNSIQLVAQSLGISGRWESKMSKKVKGRVAEDMIVGEEDGRWY